ncbi:MAG: hypothetical protein MAG551_00921 [Candidatus Scalindua arabica]|uniref:Type II toxin-antitoxin system mRNA interferase toxin, RelE/StbE family n=1 Tax=Candidatus Scalindua arabica TaxID=1127984 RepID=A0A941W1V9_9BACT|nr:hypothetical protein [Candidatus Scalindua arabica]
MYKLAIKESLDRKFKKLQRKDKELLRLIEKKVQNILSEPHRFKPLRKPLQNKRRVHIGGSYVLVYEVNENEKLVTLIDFNHHDNIYK